MSRKSPEEFPKSDDSFRLGSFTFRIQSHELTDDGGQLVPLRHQSAKVLAFLLRHNGQVVLKSDLIDAVWGGLAVSDDSLVQCVSEIRRCLNDTDHNIIQTAARRGYRIVARLVPDGSRLDARPSIAVLAFDDYSAGHDRGHLSDAIAEAITAALSRFPELAIFARNTSFHFRDGAIDVRGIAEKHGVGYLVEGSQQKSGDRLRVTVRLIDAKEDRHLWSETYDHALGVLLIAQDDIVRQVAATVAQKVLNIEGRRAIDGTHKPGTALVLSLEARQHLIRMTPESNRAALAAYEASIAADPRQPYGYAGLAFVYVNGHRWGWTDQTPKDALDAARAAALTALELDPDYYDAHAAMAYVHLQENDLARAISRAERALLLNPNDIYVMSDLAEYLGYAGQLDEAGSLLRTAIRNDPHHPDMLRWNLAWIEWLSGNSSAALKTIGDMTHVPTMANRVLAVIHVSLGNLDAARAAIDRIRAVHPDYSLDDIRRNYAGKFALDSDLDRTIEHLRAAGLAEPGVK